MDARRPVTPHVGDGGEKRRVVARRDQVDGSAQQRRLHDRPPFESAIEILPPEPLDTRPEPDVAVRRVLVLDPAQTLEHAGKRRAHALQEELPGEEPTVQRAFAQHSLRHDTDILPDVLATLAAFLGVSAVVICTPGQDTALTIRNTLVGGRRNGFATAAGVACGQAVWTLAASAGLVALLNAWEPVFHALKLLGGLYLVYLGLHSIRRALSSGPSEHPATDEA